MFDITVRVPETFDVLMREHVEDAGASDNVRVITDDMRRAYVAALLAAVLEGMGEVTMAAALVRLNGMGRGVH